jgi:surface antigen
MNAAAARLYEGRSIGTVERWRNPNTNDAGSVELVKSFEAHKMPCRTLSYTIRFETRRDSPTHYVINWCKIQEGEWKIVELVPPR